MSSLWTQIDAYLLQSVHALEGQHLLFDNVTVVVGEEFDPDHVDVPFVLIRGYEAEEAETEGPFGDGVWHLEDIQYPYELVYYSDSADIDGAREIAKDASAVLREMIRSDPCLSGIGVSEDGEVVKNVTFVDRQAFVRGVGGQNREHRYVAQCQLSFIVYGRI